MPGIILTNARVRALKSRKTVHEVRDGKLRGFGSPGSRFGSEYRREGEEATSLD
ncbi:MAG: hypothetical protein OXF26_08940 [Alphaproteobacteria bacterium]|nr:hypothetical protein [Alphaproteobacteria bacterium]